MKKLLPLLIVSTLLIGCDSKTEKIKVACSNLFTFSKFSDMENTEKYQREVGNLFSPPPGIDYVGTNYRYTYFVCEEFLGR